MSVMAFDQRLHGEFTLDCITTSSGQLARRDADQCIVLQVYDEISRLEDDGKKVTRFSITGYSLGGLIARYLVGVLHPRPYRRRAGKLRLGEWRLDPHRRSGASAQTAL